jgi:hypothetical protein
MVEEAKSWIRENSTLIYFLIAQLIAIGAAGSSIIAYMVRLETRVAIIETRGSEFTMTKIDEVNERVAKVENGLQKDQNAVDSITVLRDRITVLEQHIRQNELSIERLVQQYIRDREKDGKQ